ncbi:MAG TPA: ribosome maturation factor RimP [Candidatus Limnocylindrales bacterium]|nr:ribosome maturation factor RimP [Candidatus Limnocylindrales bacterium]
MKNEIINSVRTLVTPVVESEGMELVDIEFKKEGKIWYLRIFIDKPGGVTLLDCEKVSREVEVLLDIEDIIDRSYTLEVSSPGLDRPLKTKEDYLRFQGKLVKIKTFSSINGQKVFSGYLQGMQDDKVRIRTKSNQEIEIPYENISKSRLEVEF